MEIPREVFLESMRRLVRVMVGAFLCYGVFAPIFFFLMFAWFTPRFYLMRARAIRNGTYGSGAYRKSVTHWQAQCSQVYARLFARILFVKIYVYLAEGAQITPGKSHIIISNHLSWFDTVWYPGLCEMLGLTSVRFVVKESFREHWLAYFVLTITWVEAAFAFVSRSNPRHTDLEEKIRREKDLERVREASRIALNDGGSLLTFCEGTRGSDPIIGKPRPAGFIAQTELLPACQIVSLTQCYDGPVGPKIGTAYSYFGRTIVLDVRVFEPLAPNVDRRAWLEQEFKRKAELIRAHRS